MGKARQELVANAKGAVWSSVPSRKGYSKFTPDIVEELIKSILEHLYCQVANCKGFDSGLEHRNRQKG